MSFNKNNSVVDCIILQVIDPKTKDLTATTTGPYYYPIFQLSKKRSKVNIFILIF